MKFLFLLLLASACFESGESPEAVLRDFTNARLSKVVDRDFVLKRTTGKMHATVEAMNEEEFKTFSDLRKYHKDSFRVISKSCQEKRCYVTYSLGYRQEANDKTSWNSEVKKIAEILSVEGKWLISDVSNIKTYHETTNPIDVNP